MPYLRGFARRKAKAKVTLRTHKHLKRAEQTRERETKEEGDLIWATRVRTVGGRVR